MSIKTILAASLLFAVPVAALADPTGNWTRPNGEVASFSSSDGKLYCKITQGKSPGFEMCNGMVQTGPDEWQGGGMKHPEMPGFMTFNGTITLAGKSSLSIKGCAIGQMLCDAETWTKAK